MNRRLLIKAIYIGLAISLLAMLSCKPQAAPAALAEQEDTTITYQREGGFSGLSQEWQIFPDGRIIGPGDQEMQVSREAAAPLFTQLANIVTSAGDKSYITDDACCDQFIYTITIVNGDQETTLRTSDGAKHPQAVSSLITAIEDLLLAAEPVQ